MQKGFKKIGLGLVAVGLSIVLLLTAAIPVCEAGPAAEKVVRIGLHGCYTGALAATGVPFGYATMDYVKYINEQGGLNGVKLEVIWEETGRAPVVQELIAHKRFVERGAVVECSIICGGVEVCAPSLKRNKVPMALITAASEAMVTKPVPWVFAAEASLPDAGAVISKALKEELFPEKRMRLGVMIYDHLSGWSATEGIKWACEHLDMDIVGFEVVPFLGALDATTEWLRLAEKKPDIVVLIICGASLATCIKDSVRLEIKEKDIEIFHCNYCLEEYIPVVGADAVEGWYTYQWNPTSVEAGLPGMKAVFEAAKRNRGWEPEDIPAIYIKCWIQTAIMVEGIRLALGKVGFEHLTGSAVREGLASIKDFDAGGLMPPISMDNSHPYWSRSVRLFQIREGEMWPLSGRRHEYYGLAGDWYK